MAQLARGGRGAARLLEQEREAAAARVADLAAELDAVVAASQDVNLDDEHDAEGATVAFERQRLAALLDHARAVLEELDAAARRLAAGAYGRCQVCGRPIGDERLAALPTATRCVACAAPTARAWRSPDRGDAG